MNKIHIGNVIIQTLAEKDLKMSWLARQVHYEESNFCKKLKRNSIHLDLLEDISNVLHVDFFAYYTKELQEKWKNLP